MLIEAGGKQYRVKSIEDLELRHVAQLQYELATTPELGRITPHRTLDDISAAFGRWGNLTKVEQRHDPDGVFLTCFMLWASRVLAGEDVSLLEAISIPVASIATILEPGDEGQDEDGPKARKPASAGGGRPGKRSKRH